MEGGKVGGRVGSESRREGKEWKEKCMGGEGRSE